jgi:ribosomal protein L22
MSVDEPDKTAGEDAEGTPSAEAPRSDESSEAPAAAESARGTSAEDAPSTPPNDDELADADALAAAVSDDDESADETQASEADAEDDDEPEADAGDEPAAETAAPKRRRRPTRRRSAEPAEEASEETPPAPAPTRRRARRDPNLPAPVVRAQARYVRSSARKARLVCDHIRGKSVEEARAILALTPRAIARDWSKLLESAVANAEHNHELVGEDLFVKAVHADEGPTIKRFRPRAMGRATRIRKRTSHLTILLTPKD